MVEQMKRRAKKSPGTAAGLSGSALGALFVLHSRRVARHIDARHTRRQGEGRLRLSHRGGTTRGCYRPCAAGSFSSGDFSTSASTTGLRCAESAVPHGAEVAVRQRRAEATE